MKMEQKFSVAAFGNKPKTVQVDVRLKFKKTQVF